MFFGTGGQPELDLANVSALHFPSLLNSAKTCSKVQTCSSVSNPVFEGTQLPNCSFLASDIQSCQAAGKIVTISLGGATGSDTFESQSQATGFADTIWNLFLGGSSSTLAIQGLACRYSLCMELPVAHAAAHRLPNPGYKI